MTISYAITVCNELEEIQKLLNFLQVRIREEDEIVIQYDEQSVTDEVMEYLTLMEKMHKYTVVGFPLNKDFGSFKNNLKNHCTKDYIFSIDADEIPHEVMVEYLPQLLQSNQVDVIFVPRVNTVEGLTDEHIQKWKWKVNEQGWVNWPDNQHRIFRNKPEIKWKNKVHEQIIGWHTYAELPNEDDSYALYHIKDIDRQRKQNEFYSTI
jgi:hypothetical protein